MNLSNALHTVVNVNTSVLVFGLIGYTLTFIHNIMILLSYGLLNSLMFNILYLTVMISSGVMIVLPSFYGNNILYELHDYFKSKKTMCKIVDSPSHEEVLLNEVNNTDKEVLTRLNSLSTSLSELDKNMNSTIGDILECLNTLELKIISVERKVLDLENKDQSIIEDGFTG